MLERLIKRVMDAQIAELIADPTGLETLLVGQNRLTRDETAAQIDQFLSAPPNVTLHYPRKEAQFPLYAIVMTNETEYQPGTFLGDFGELLSAEQAEACFALTLENSEALATMFMRTYTIDAYALHPDLTITLYEVAKLALMRARSMLNEQGVLRSQFSGSTLQPLKQDEWGPDYVFDRQLTLRVIEMFNVVGAGFPPFRLIDGGHIAGGSTTPPPGVKTLVTPYTPTVDSDEA